MRALMGRVRTRAGLAVVGGALLLTVGGTATAAVVTSNPATDEVSDTSTVAPTTSPATTTPVTDAPVVDAPAPTVAAVTEAPAPAPEPQPDSSIGTTDANGHYAPAIPVGPGDPPLATDQQAPPTMPNNQGQVSFPSDGPAVIGG